MREWRGWVKVIGLVLLLQLLCEKRAEAYLDPGSGSYLLQLLVAGLLGGAYGVKCYWRRIKGYLAGLFRAGRDGKRNA